MMKQHISQIVESEVAVSIPSITDSKPDEPNPVFEDISHLLLKNEDEIADQVADIFGHVFRIISSTLWVAFPARRTSQCSPGPGVTKQTPTKPIFRIATGGTARRMLKDGSMSFKEM